MIHYEEGKVLENKYTRLISEWDAKQEYRLWHSGNFTLHYLITDHFQSITVTFHVYIEEKMFLIFPYITIPCLFLLSPQSFCKKYDELENNLTAFIKNHPKYRLFFVTGIKTIVYDKDSIRSGKENIIKNALLPMFLYKKLTH